jgi:hypothetical protein
VIGFLFFIACLVFLIWVANDIGSYYLIERDAEKRQRRDWEWFTEKEQESLRRKVEALEFDYDMTMVELERIEKGEFN